MKSATQIKDDCKNVQPQEVFSATHSEQPDNSHVTESCHDSLTVLLVLIRSGWRWWLNSSPSQQSSCLLKDAQLKHSCYDLSLWQCLVCKCDGVGRNSISWHPGQENRLKIHMTSIGNLKKYFLIKFVFHLLNSSTLKTLEESRRFFWFLLIKVPFLFLNRF